MKKTNFLNKMLLLSVLSFGSFAVFAQTQISDRAGLEAIANDLSGSYVLTADIDLSGADWSPLGTWDSPFTGTLDGNGHIISGLRYNNTANDGTAYPGGSRKVGLFSTIGNGSTVKKLGIESAYVRGGKHVGAIAGSMKGTAKVEECYVAGSYIETGDHGGSIAGNMEGASLIQNCYGNGEVYSRSAQASGLVGMFKNNDALGGAPKISKSYFSGIVRSGNPSAIGAWQDASPTYVEYSLCLAPYVLGGGNLRVVVGNGTNLTAIYSLSTTVMGGDKDVFSGSPITNTSDQNYGNNKRHGENIPDGDDNAKKAGQSAFYESVLQWDFVSVWKFLDNVSYPVLKWQTSGIKTYLLHTKKVYSVIEGQTLDLVPVKNSHGLDIIYTKTNAADPYTISGTVITPSGITNAVEVQIGVQVASGSFVVAESTISVWLAPNGVITLRTPEDLLNLQRFPNSEFVLANDIDMTGVAFTPFASFSGTLNGQGHIIKGITFNDAGQGSVGLFSTLSGGTVRNLGIENANINGNADVGGIAGVTNNGALIENCYVVNSYIEGRDHVGAIVGGMKQNSAVKNSYSNARVHSRDHQAAGIAGIMQRKDKIENCYYAGIVSNASNRAVGIGGFQDDGDAPAGEEPKIQNCVALTPYYFSNEWSGSPSSAPRIFFENGRPRVLVNNYGLSTAWRGKPNFSEGTNFPTDDSNYGADKMWGADVTPADALTQAFYETTLGWDFTTVWTLRSGAYPVLKHQPAIVAVQPILTNTYAATTFELPKDNTTGLDLNRYIKTGYGFDAVIEVTETDKLTLEGTVLKVATTFNPTTEVTTTVLLTSNVTGFRMSFPITVKIIPAVSLTALTVSGVEFTFDPTVLEYNLAVDGAVENVTVDATSGEGILVVAGGTGVKTLNYGHNTLIVAATNGNFTKDYIINIDRGLFSVMPDLHGTGKRNVNIHSRNGGGSGDESVYKLLIGKDAINGQTNNKWCPTGDGGEGSQVWVIFSFAQNYEVGAVEWRDKDWLEGTSGQVAEWKVEITADTDPATAVWTEVVNRTGEQALKVKYAAFTPQTARYMRFTVTKTAHTAWIYGFDIFGKYVSDYEPVNVVSRGKTILNYTGGYWEGAGRETSANIIDGNTGDDTDPWASYEDGQSVEIDLGETYTLSNFTLKNQMTDNDKITGYRVYVKANESDEWGSAIEGVFSTTEAGMRTSEIALTVSQLRTGRYVKLEIPAEYKNRSKGWIRIKEFQAITGEGLLDPVRYEFSESICEGESYNFNDEDKTTTGDYVATLTAAAANGADSIVTLHLTVLPTYEESENLLINESQLPYDFKGLYTVPTTAIGTFDHKIEAQTAAGCDSIVHLHVIITPTLGVMQNNVTPLVITPNPVKLGEYVQVNYNFTETDKQGLVMEVFNTLGEMVYADRPATYPVTLNKFPASGIYTVRITTGNNVQMLGKILVK